MEEQLKASEDLFAAAKTKEKEATARIAAIEKEMKDYANEVCMCMCVCV